MVSAVVLPSSMERASATPFAQPAEEHYPQNLVG
jgi:hypothetical protein